MSNEQPYSKETQEKDLGFPSLHQLKEIREFLVPKWIDWGQKNNKFVSEKGEGMCRFTSAFLLGILGHGWKLNGGHAEFYHHFDGWIPRPMGGGYSDGKNWFSHYWIEKKGVIVDLTASQFGGSEILVVRKNDPRFKSTIVSKQDIQEALFDVKERAKIWSDDWIDKIITSNMPFPVVSTSGKSFCSLL
ncbi:MAG TPA: hypothetical protein VIY47_09005 [Ignavibacteriaceae bacterium]